MAVTVRTTLTAEQWHKVEAMKSAGRMRARETVGDDWMSPEWFRFGASTLLNDVLMQLEKERTGFVLGP